MKKPIFRLSGKPLELKKTVAPLVLLYAPLYAAALLLLFVNLSDRLMWGDEAETAILARNILEFGVPVVDDGKNFLTQYSHRKEYNEDNIWTWNTWLPYYLCAISFRIFGPTTFAARLPFVIIGFLAVVLIRWVALAFYEKEETAFIATILLVTSAPFLIHTRQCRYYSTLSLGVLWMLMGYHKIAFERKRQGGLNVALALLVLFYSSFISFVGNFVAAGIHSLFLGRKNRDLMRSIIVYLGLALLGVLPWVIYSGMLEKSSSIRPFQFFNTLGIYISRINFHVFPLLLLLIPPISLLKMRATWKQWIPSEKTSVLLLVVMCQLLCLSIFPFVYFRYLTAIIPVIFILEAHILRNCISNRPTRFLLVIVLATTNLLGVLSLYPIRAEHKIESPIYGFIKELANPYEDKLENVVDFLKANASETESLLVPDPGNTLVFYTNMKVIYAMDPQNQGIVHEPDWVLTEAPDKVFPWYDVRLKLDTFGLASVPYKRIELQVRDTPAGASRPDPHYHQGLTTKKLKTYVIYKRLRDGEKIDNPE